MEAFVAFTLFGSAVWFSIILTVLFISLVASDVNENGYVATVLVATVLLGNYFWGDFPTLEYITWKYAGMYLFAGFLFSLIRTFFKGRELTSKYNKKSSKYHEQWTLTEYKKKFDLKGNVFRWVFLFPVSALTWIFGTVVKDLWNLAYAKLGKLHEKILNL